MSDKSQKFLEVGAFALGLLLVGSCTAAAFYTDKNTVWFGVVGGLALMAALLAGVFAFTRRPPWLKRAVEWGSVLLGLLGIGSCVAATGVSDLDDWAGLAGGLVVFGLLIATVFSVTRGVRWVGRLLEGGVIVGVVAGIGLLGACTAVAVAPSVGVIALVLTVALVIGVIAVLASRERHDRESEIPSE